MALGIGAGAPRHGMVVQVDPIKPTLKAPGTYRLKLKYDKLLSIFAFNFSLRRFTTVRLPATAAVYREVEELTKPGGGAGDGVGVDVGPGN